MDFELIKNIRIFFKLLNYNPMINNTQMILFSKNSTRMREENILINHEIEPENVLPRS